MKTPQIAALSVFTPLVIKGKPDIVLKDGTIVTHSRLPNGAWQATVVGDKDGMTSAQWQEYCDAVRAQS